MYFKRAIENVVYFLKIIRFSRIQNCSLHYSFLKVKVAQFIYSQVKGLYFILGIC